MRQVAWGGMLPAAVAWVVISTSATANARNDDQPIHSAPRTNQFKAVARGKDTLVAVGPGVAIWSSSDGAAWTRRDSGLPFALYAVAYGNDTFVALGNEGDRKSVV